MMNVPASTGRQWYFMVTLNGDLATFFWSTTFWKETDSTSFRRTQRPTATMTAESTNGTRQPQAMNCSSVSVVCRTTKMTLAMMKPIGAPSCGKVP